MNYLKKVWVRILFSLLLGSFFAEIIHVYKGYMPIQISNFIVMSTATFSFVMITLLLKLRKKKDSELEQGKEDILDA